MNRIISLLALSVQVAALGLGSALGQWRAHRGEQRPRSSIAFLIGTGFGSTNNEFTRRTCHTQTQQDIVS
ncbi:hypothetical protein GQ600_23231 [Phytophthora cactorum]|nr:hypothetical protein GQ600_23231 [Phytophthora cactorum]